MFPKIKKKITSFLLNEEGKVTKQSLVSLGSFLSAAVIGGVLATKATEAQVHTNNLSTYYTSGTAVGSHAHHSNNPTGTGTGTGSDSGDGCCGTGSGSGCTGTDASCGSCGGAY